MTTAKKKAEQKDFGMTTPFRTTVIGSMPKPVWLQRPPTPSGGNTEHRLSGAGGVPTPWAFEGAALRVAQDDATRLAVYEQERAGIDIVSDGEQRRTSYLYSVIAGMAGFDFETLAEKSLRAGRAVRPVPRCIGEIRADEAILVDDVRFLKAVTDRPVKVAMPGPMTVCDSTYNIYYPDERAQAFAWAAAANKEAKRLEAAGADVIQFDEPAFSRYPEKTVDWGVEALDRCLDGIGATTCVHVCYGYPTTAQFRPVVDSYPSIIAALERSQVQQLALEFCGSGIDPAVLKACPSKTVLFGVVFNGGDTVEDPDDIADRLLAAADYLPPAQLQAAPDCGLVPLAPEIAHAKLKALVEGAARARARL